MLWVYILSLNTCIFKKFIIPYILFINVESYILSVTGGSNVREMCLNNMLFGVNLAFRYMFGYLIIILALTNIFPIKRTAKVINFSTCYIKGFCGVTCTFIISQGSQIVISKKYLTNLLLGTDLFHSI